jgi:hypothetical protein
MLATLIVEINKEVRELALLQLRLISFSLPRRAMSASFPEMLVIWQHLVILFVIPTPQLQNDIGICHVPKFTHPRKHY